MIDNNLQRFKPIKSCLICNLESSFSLILFPDNYVKGIKEKPRDNFRILRFFIKRTLYSSMFEKKDKKRGLKNIQKMNVYFKKTIKLNAILKRIVMFINKWLLQYRDKNKNYMENIDQMINIFDDKDNHSNDMSFELKKILSTFKNENVKRSAYIKFQRYNENLSQLPIRFLNIFASSSDDETTMDSFIGVLMNVSSQIQNESFLLKCIQRVYIYKAAWQRILKIISQNISSKNSKNMIIIKHLVKLIKTFHNPKLHSYSYNGICSPLSECNLHSVFVTLIIYYSIFNYRFTNVSEEKTLNNEINNQQKPIARSMIKFECDLSIKNKTNSQNILLSQPNTKDSNTNTEQRFKINWERLIQLFGMIDQIKSNNGFKFQNFLKTYKQFWGVIFGNFLKHDWQYSFNKIKTKIDLKVFGYKSYTSSSNDLEKTTLNYEDFLRQKNITNKINESIVIASKTNKNKPKIYTKKLHSITSHKLSIDKDPIKKKKDIQKFLRKTISSAYLSGNINITKSKRKLSSIINQTKSCKKLLSSQKSKHQPLAVSSGSINNTSKISSNSAQNISNGEHYLNESLMKRDSNLLNSMVPNLLNSIDYEFYQRKIVEACEVIQSGNISHHELLNQKCLSFNLFDYCHDKQNNFGDFYKTNIVKPCSLQSPDCAIRKTVF